jgi:hypothetical protein
MRAPIIPISAVYGTAPKTRVKDWTSADPIRWGDPMRRRDLLLSALVFPLLSTPVRAQAPERVWRVGVLTPTRPVVDLFRQFTLPELARLGFVEGRNLALDIRSADGDYERRCRFHHCDPGGPSRYQHDPDCHGLCG